MNGSDTNNTDDPITDIYGIDLLIEELHSYVERDSTMELGNM